MTGQRPSGSSSLGNPTFVLSDAAFILLRDLVLQRTGVQFDESKRGAMTDKLSELVAANGLTSFLDYYYLLRYDENSATHLSALMDRLAVPETFFWRQAEQINALATVIAPAHFLAYPGRPLRIWSAGCCSGEEPLSIAIALAEHDFLDAGQVEITATDGSAQMIARAERGIYGERSFRQLPLHLKAKYFEQDGLDRWRPIEAVRRPIRYGVANLVEPNAVKRHAACDVIFCRNVFIYFSDEAIRATVRLFAEYMSPDGFLFVAASESLSRLGVELELAEIAGAFTYVKLGRREVVERSHSRQPDPCRELAFIHQAGEP